MQRSFISRSFHEQCILSFHQAMVATTVMNGARVLMIGMSLGKICPGPCSLLDGARLEFSRAPPEVFTGEVRVTSLIEIEAWIVECQASRQSWKLIAAGSKKSDS